MSDAQRYNVRMAGIGGQGVVTASHIVSNAVVIEKGFSSLVPFFGSEKRNAPVESYVRISNQEIYEIQLGRGQDLRDEISRAVISNGWSLLSMQVVGMSLEDIFLKLTTQEEN